MDTERVCIKRDAVALTRQTGADQKRQKYVEIKACFQYKNVSYTSLVPSAAEVNKFILSEKWMSVPNFNPSIKPQTQPH